MSTASVKTPEPSHSGLVQRTVEACELARQAAAIAAEGIATGSMSRLNAIRQCEKDLDAIDVEVDSGVTTTISHVPEDETRQLLACMKVMIGLERIGDLLLSFATSAQAAGGQLLVGGKVLSRPGHFVEPAIVLAGNDWDIVQHETFGPILYLIAVDSIDEAIRLQNESAYGLSSGLFTQRLQHAEQYLSHQGSDCGIANVNIGTSGAEIGGAFGGEKDTGGGREAGSDAWKTYMRRQTNTVNWSSALPLAQGIEFDIAP